MYVKDHWTTGEEFLESITFGNRTSEKSILAVYLFLGCCGSSGIEAKDHDRTFGINIDYEKRFSIRGVAIL